MRPSLLQLERAIAVGLARDFRWLQRGAPDLHPVFLLVGSPGEPFDAISPMVGSFLGRMGFQGTYIGDLGRPVGRSSIAEKVAELVALAETGPFQPYVVAVEAAAGSSGDVTLKLQPLKPGARAGKALRPVGSVQVGISTGMDATDLDAAAMEALISRAEVTARALIRFARLVAVPGRERPRPVFSPVSGQASRVRFEYLCPACGLRMTGSKRRPASGEEARSARWCPSCTARVGVTLSPDELQVSLRSGSRSADFAAWREAFLDRLHQRVTAALGFQTFRYKGGLHFRLGPGIRLSALVRQQAIRILLRAEGPGAAAIPEILRRAGKLRASVSGEGTDRLTLELPRLKADWTRLRGEEPAAAERVSATLRRAVEALGDQVLGHWEQVSMAAVQGESVQLAPQMLDRLTHQMPQAAEMLKAMATAASVQKQK